MSEQAPADDGSADPTADGGTTTHTLRLELDDEPGELAAALDPIAEHGGNLLSVFHERGNLTPGGRVPIEVDLECPAGRFDAIVDTLRERDVTVVAADEEYYGEALSVILTGHVVDTNLSETLRAIEEGTVVSIKEMQLSAAGGTKGQSSALFRLGARTGQREAALDRIREVADENGLDVVEPLEVAE
ncbi:MAG: amino acid-binding protein [Halolamina sp.]|uniref:amino acid-binding protein n=1 Tax=Halolamina sp. TaxID=1940283 RepID=UPI002FC364C7